MNTVLVTGATDGLGRALAARLAGEGDTVLAARPQRGARSRRAGRAARRAGRRAARRRRSRLARRRCARSPTRCPTQPRRARQQRRHRQRRRRRRRSVQSARRLRAALRGQLPRGLPARRAACATGCAAAAPARIVNVASPGQEAIDFDDVMLEHGYDGARAYCQSKLAQIMHAFDLAEELEGDGRDGDGAASGDLHADEDRHGRGRDAAQHARGGRRGDAGPGRRPGARRRHAAATSTARARPAPTRRPTTPTRGAGCASSPSAWSAPSGVMPGHPGRPSRRAGGGDPFAIGAHDVSPLLHCCNSGDDRSGSARRRASGHRALGLAAGHARAHRDRGGRLAHDPAPARHHARGPDRRAVRAPRGRLPVEDVACPDRERQRSRAPRTGAGRLLRGGRDEPRARHGAGGGRPQRDLPRGGSARAHAAGLHRAHPAPAAGRRRRRLAGRWRSRGERDPAAQPRQLDLPSPAPRPRLGARARPRRRAAHRAGRGGGAPPEHPVAARTGARRGTPWA